MKKFLLYTFTILFIISIYKDLSLHSTEQEEILSNTEQISTSLPYDVVKVKIMPGDTFIAIVDQINSNSPSPYNLDQIMDDFKSLNPNTDPYHLTAHAFYYFPLYKNEDDEKN